MMILLRMVLVDESACMQSISLFLFEQSAVRWAAPSAETNERMINNSITLSAVDEVDADKARPAAILSRTGS